MSIEDCERAYAIAKGRAEDQYSAIRSLWRRLDELAPNLDNERKEIRLQIMGPNAALPQLIIDADEAKLRLAAARDSE